MRSNNGRPLERNRKFVDSPLEADGFELLVPREVASAHVRGALVDEEAMIEALRSGQRKATYPNIKIDPGTAHRRPRRWVPGCLGRNVVPPSHAGDLLQAGAPLRATAEDGADAIGSRCGSARVICKIPTAENLRNVGLNYLYVVGSG
jgi:hypothetical protein